MTARSGGCQGLPEDAGFGIVGVNGGVATRGNPCLAEQLTWAADTPALQVYVNTANPGQVRDRVSTWPATGDSPYGPCTGGSGPACSWVYGQTRAAVDVHGFLLPAAAQAHNRATLEGMAASFTRTGATVGPYSTGQQWREIVGWVPPGSPLHHLDSWLAGVRTRAEAADHCELPALTGGGRVVLAQYVTTYGGVLLDHDLRC